MVLVFLKTTDGHDITGMWVLCTCAPGRILTVRLRTPPNGTGQKTIGGGRGCRVSHEAAKCSSRRMIHDGMSSGAYIAEQQADPYRMATRCVFSLDVRREAAGPCSLTCSSTGEWASRRCQLRE